MKTLKSFRRSRARRQRSGLLFEALEQRSFLAADVGLGSVAGQFKIADGLGGIPAHTFPDFERFGNSIVSLGDIDGDNINDLAVGAKEDDGEWGAVYVLRMNANGRVKTAVKISDGIGGLARGTLNYPDKFGSALAVADVDRDGRRELIVGANRDRTLGNAAGAVYVLFLNPNGSVRSTGKIANGLGGFDATTLAEGNQFGVSLASVGDWNGDGIEDVAVGSGTIDDHPADHDAVFLLQLNRDGSVQSKVVVDNRHPTLSGLSNSDAFGTSMAAIGDVDKNGVMDLAVGATGDDTGGAGRGAVYLLLMNADGTPRVVRKFADGSGLPTGTLRDSDAFGHAVAAVADLDGDGVGELAVSAFDDATGGLGRGAVYLLFLNAEGNLKSIRKIAHGRENFQIDGAGSSHFGTSIVWLGGNSNLLAVGAAYDDTGNESSGAVHFLALRSVLRPNPTIPHDDSPPADPPPRPDDELPPRPNDQPLWVDAFTKIAHRSPGIGAISAGDRFADSMAAIGDLDGDGNVDLFVGASHRDLHRTSPHDDHGAAYVLFMRPDGTVRESRSISHGDGGLSLALYDKFGTSVTAVGDLNHDGIVDLAVGAVGDDTGKEFRDRGAVYLLFMNRDGSVKASRKMADGAAGIGTLADYGHFGSSLAGIGDLNRDGVPDLVVGAADDHTGGSYRGAVYVLFLNSDGTVKSSRKIASQTSGLGELRNRDSFGSSVTAIGDVNSDGVVDLAVGAVGDDANGDFGGAVHLLFLKRDGTVQASRKLTGQNRALAEVGHQNGFGSSLAAPGDLNGDGIADLLVGASTDFADGEPRGAVYALLLNADGSVRSWSKIGHQTGGFGPLHFGDSFANSLAALGDLDHDGMLDIVVGAVGDDSGCDMGPDCRFDNRGALYVLNLAPTEWKPPADTPDDEPPAGPGDPSPDPGDGPDPDDLPGPDDPDPGDEPNPDDDPTPTPGDDPAPTPDDETPPGPSDDAVPVPGDDPTPIPPDDAPPDDGPQDPGSGPTPGPDETPEDPGEIPTAPPDDSPDDPDHETPQIPQESPPRTQLPVPLPEEVPLTVDQIFEQLGLVDAWLTDLLSEDGTRQRVLQMSGANQELNLSDVAAAALDDIELIDIRGVGRNTLSMTAIDIENISSTGTLSVHANQDDTLNMGAGWLLRGTVVQDGTFLRIFQQADVTLQVAGPYDWSNPANSKDVNGNGAVEPQDVLNVINALNAHVVVQPDGSLVDAASLSDFPGYLIDAHPDGYLVPLDALVIVNALNEQSLIHAEGEDDSEVILAMAPWLSSHSASFETDQSSSMDQSSSLAICRIDPAKNDVEEPTRDGEQQAFTSSMMDELFAELEACDFFAEGKS